MTTSREEAQDPATAPERLHELINLPGNRGDNDSDGGWCRELVVANPSAPLETLQELAADQDDFMARLNASYGPWPGKTHAGPQWRGPPASAGGAFVLLGVDGLLDLPLHQPRVDPEAVDAQGDLRPGT